MRNRLLLALSLTTGLTSPAAAEKWYYLSTAKEEINYADADSLQVTGSTETLNVMSASLNGLGPEANIYYTNVKVEIDCSGHRLRWLQTQPYGNQRQLLTPPGFDTEWQQIGDQDAAEDARAFACDGLKRENPVANPFDDADEYFYYYYDETGAPAAPSSS